MLTWNHIMLFVLAWVCLATLATAGFACFFFAKQTTSKNDAVCRSTRRVSEVPAKKELQNTQQDATQQPPFASQHFRCPARTRANHSFFAKNGSQKGKLNDGLPDFTNSQASSKTRCKFSVYFLSLLETI